MNENFLFAVLALVEEIPRGKVATYGQLARLSGYPRNARLVGKALKYSDMYGDYPCHRVVNNQGHLASSFREQKQLLFEENVPFKQNGHVDMKKALWMIEEED